MLAEYKINLTPVTDEAATGTVKQAFVATKAKLGFVPNMYRGMGNSAGYLGTYLHGYAQFRENSGFTPAEQELIFLVISHENQCDYCTAAHSMIADKVSKLDAATLASVRANNPIADAKLQALANFTTHAFKTRGLIGKSEAEAFLAAGYQDQQIMEIILAIAVKTLSNYSNHLFHTDLDTAFTPYKVLA